MGGASQGSTNQNSWNAALSNMWNAASGQSTNQGYNSSTGQTTSTGQNTSGSQTTSTGQNTSGSQNTGSSVGSSTSTTGGQSTSTQKVWNPQTGVLEDVYAGADRLASGQGPMARQVSGVSRDAVNAWTDALQPGGNPYFSANVQGAIDQATQSFKKGVLPELDARGVGAGSYGTSRDQLARGEAAGMFGQGVSQMVGSMYADQYGTDAASRLAALNMAPQIQGTVTAPLTTAAGIVGGPTVLSSGQSTNTGRSTSSNVASSQGTSTSQGTTASQGTSTSQGTTASQGTNSSVGSSYGQSTNTSAGGGQTMSSGAGVGQGSQGSVNILGK